VENLLDPAHIDISHDRTSGGGKRENARPYEMHIDQDSLNNPQGFTGRHRQDAKKNFTEFRFEAPGILRQYGEFALPNGGLIRFGSALHCMPLTLGRSRLLFRVYSHGLPAIAQFILKTKPLWLRHLNSCLVLEQDVGLIATQEDHFARKLQQQQQHQSSVGVKDDYLLIKSSDAYVGAYRAWLDKVGGGMPVRLCCSVSPRTPRNFFFEVSFRHFLSHRFCLASSISGFKDWPCRPVSHSVMCMACPSCHQDWTQRRIGHQIKE
jgi:Pheophorbide a oxygenase